MTRPREYRFVRLLLGVFLLMPMAALAQTSNTQAAQDRAILHDVALSFLARSDHFSENLEEAWRLHADELGMRKVTDARYAHCEPEESVSGLSRGERCFRPPRERRHLREVPYRPTDVAAGVGS